ncbi:MAG: hypothetical protein HOV97_05285 [Nonomuraea sp.]|nr:hypothetical protein [Nonomuraea sp.]
MTDDWVAESSPSPFCGRLDDHDPHPWKRGRNKYECPGPPVITRAEQEAVDKSIRAARKDEQ